MPNMSNINALPADVARRIASHCDGLSCEEHDGQGTALSADTTHWTRLVSRDWSDQLRNPVTPAPAPEPATPNDIVDLAERAGFYDSRRLDEALRARAPGVTSSNTYTTLCKMAGKEGNLPVLSVVLNALSRDLEPGIQYQWQHPNGPVTRRRRRDGAYLTLWGECISLALQWSRNSDDGYVYGKVVGFLRGRFGDDVLRQLLSPSQARLMLQ